MGSDVTEPDARGSSALTVAVQGIGKAFDGPVLHDVSLEVPAGSTLALLGPSGSGKSTLLRIIAGLERPDRGTVWLGGEDVTRVPAHRRGVGVVFQDQALFPHFDVAGNVAFGLRMHKIPPAESARRVSEALELVGLSGYERRDPATLSGGEAQRVAIARALAPRPAALMLDEPLSGLDQILRERLLLELRDLFDGLAVTVIAVTHDPTEAGALGQRMAVLLGGAIAQIGEPGEMLSRPETTEVARLLGHRNIAPAGDAAGDGVVTPWGTFRIPDAPEAPFSVLVPPDAITADDAGPLSGEVTGRIFRGGSAFAVVTGANWPSLDVPAPPQWKVGDTVRVRITEERIRPLP